MTVLEKEYMETYIRRSKEKSRNEEEIIKLLKVIINKLDKIKK